MEKTFFPDWLARIFSSETIAMDILGWKKNFHPNKNLPHGVISSFFLFPFWHFGKTVFCRAHYTSSMTVELTWTDKKYRKGEILSRWLAPELRRHETGVSFSTAPRGAVRLDRNRPQIWPTLSSPPSLECGRRIWFKMECFRGGRKEGGLKNITSDLRQMSK